MEHIHITEVVLRDGLQNQAVHLSTQDKLKLMQLLAAAGVTSFEATSFVSPRAVPQMADAAQLMAQVQANASISALRVSALVPNMKGLERAMAAGVREVAVVLSVTEAMNQRNVNMSLKEAARVSEEVVRAAAASGLATRAYLAVAFECPFEGLVDSGSVVAFAQRMAKAGAQEIVIADTIGAAAPAQVSSLLRLLANDIPPDQQAIHLHDTRGFGVANAWAALEAGVRRFDSSAGGVGGCPFAPGAAGNLATEDLVLLAKQCGLETGIDLGRLADGIELAEKLLGRALGGRSMEWQRRRGPASTQARTMTL